MRTLAIAVLAAASVARAQTVPLVLAHHGRLLAEGDQAIEGPVTVRIAIYEHPAAVPAQPETLVALWSHSYDVVAWRGFYSIALGSIAEGPALPSTVFAGPARYLGITVDPGAPGAKEMEPRLPFGAVAYAFRAGSAGAADTAADLICTECVGISDVKVSEFATTFQSKGNYLTVDNAGSVTVAGSATVAGTVTATSFTGSGASLTGIPPAAVTGTAATLADLTTAVNAVIEPQPNTCPDGEALFKANADGSFDCRPSAPDRASDLACAGCVDPADLSSAVDNLFVKVGSPATSFRLESLADPPAPCSPSTAGGLFYRTTDSSFYGCNGAFWRKLTLGSALGMFTSCLEMKTAAPTTPSGAYPIDFDGDGPEQATEVYCDMGGDLGGGWTLIGQISGRHTLHATWLRSAQNVDSLKTLAIESSAFACVNAIDLAVNRATHVRFTNSDLSKWLRWPLPAGRTTSTLWNHAAGQSTIIAAPDAQVTVTRESGATGTCWENRYGIMPLYEHGGSYPGAFYNEQGNTTGGDLCASVGVQPSGTVDGFIQNGNGYDAPTGDSDWPNANINNNPHLSVWVR
jgi:hypothetical protein